HRRRRPSGEGCRQEGGQEAGVEASGQGGEMILPAFHLHRPASIAEALSIAASCDNDFDYLGGGTDLLPNYKNRLNPRRHVIALWRVEELARAGEDSFGAMTRLAVLEEDATVRRRHPGLVEAIEQVATPLVRRQATLGGNLLVE